MKDKEKMKKSEKTKKAIAILLLCIFFSALYFTVLSFESSAGYKNSVIMQIYAYGDALLVLAFLILNLGFSNGEVTPDMFSSEVDRAEAQRRADRINKNKGIAKGLLYFIIPVTFALSADIIFLFWGDMIMNMLGGLIPSAG